MPAIGSSATSRPPRVPPPPKPKAAPPPKSIGSAAVAAIHATAPPPHIASPQAAVQAITKAAGQGSAAVAHATSKAAKALTPTRSQVMTAGNVAGARTNAYTKALVNVFNHQSGPQKHAIVQGALAHPNTFESRILLQYLHSGQGVNAAIQAGGLVPDNGGIHLLGGLSKDVASVLNSVPKIGPQSNEFNVGATIGTPTAKQVGINAVKDLINLPTEVAPSIEIPLNQALGGHWGQALSTIVNGYASALEHPLQHPLNAFLAASGLAHPIAGWAEPAARKIVGMEPRNLTRESIPLTANLTHERPAAAPSPLMRIGQNIAEAMKYERNTKGQLVPRKQNTLHRLIHRGVSTLVGENERIRSAGHQQEAAAHADAFINGRAEPTGVFAPARRAARAAHAVGTALKFDPEAPLIKGSEVAGLAARRVLRRPDAAYADLQKHLDQVSANRHNLLDNPKLLELHDEYVGKIKAALKSTKSMKPKDWKLLFAVTDRYQRELSNLEQQAKPLGYFREMDDAALLRAAMMDAYLSHVPGAKRDELLGVVRPGTKAEVRAFQSNRWSIARRLEKSHPNAKLKIAQLREEASRAWEHQVVPVGTEEMRRSIGQHTAGHMPAFVPDRALEGDSAHYTSSQKRPYPAPEGKTGFAFLHGLTEPSHEALLEHRVRLRGAIDATHGVNRLDQQLVVGKANGKPYESYKAAAAAAPKDMQPIRMAPQFYPQASFDMAHQGVDMASLIEEADRRSLNIADRLKAPGKNEPDTGQWGLIHKEAAKQLRAHENAISPNVFLRSLRGANTQFRTVALATSFRHLPGVMQETLVRSVASGVGVISLFAGHGIFNKLAESNPELAARLRIAGTGGTVVGNLDALKTRQTSAHFAGTPLYPVLSEFEKFMRAPGVRQLGTLWKTWVKFTLHTTKLYMEQQAQLGGIGKAAIEEFGGRHGLLAIAMGQWGKMIDAASHGIVDESTFRRFKQTANRIYGRWTDLTPAEQTALMFSPFGMWWVNSVGWLARLPVDHPFLTGALAAANVGTEKQRQKEGLDLFAPGALPLYLQGAAPMGNKLLQLNYYSPFGVANDPLGTLESLTEPWLMSDLLLPALGDNWHGGTLESPSNPGGYKRASDVTQAPLQDLAVIFNSLGASFIPLYQKAQTVVQGGASAFDTASLPQDIYDRITGKPLPTKEPPGSLWQGFLKAVSPMKVADRPKSSSGSSGNPWGGSSSSSSNPWGRSSSSSSNPWG